MKLRFLYAILLMAIVMVKAEDDVDTDNILDNKDFGDIMNKENSGNQGRSLNVDVKNNGERQIDDESTDPDNGGEAIDPDNGKGTTDTDNGKEGTTDPDKGKEGTTDPDNGKEGTTDPDKGKEGTTDPDNGKEGTTDPDNGKEGTTNPDNGKEGTTDPDNGKEGTTDPDNGKEGTTDPDNGKGTTNPDNGKGTTDPDNGEGTTTTKEDTEIPSTIESLEDYPYQVRGENVTCILSKMTISLTVKYNTSNENKKKTLKVPSAVKVNGTCENDTNSMILTWTSFENDTETVNFADTINNNKMEFYFKKNGSTFSLNQIKLFIYLDKTNFPNATENNIELQTSSDLDLFSSATNSKYVCNVNTVVEKNGFEILITDVSLIAFNEDDNTISSKSINDCSTNGATAAVLSESANVGAIVGGIIGALVVIGIIGFIIFRRRRNSSSVRSEVA